MTFSCTYRAGHRHATYADGRSHREPGLRRRGRRLRRGHRGRAQGRHADDGAGVRAAGAADGADACGDAGADGDDAAAGDGAARGEDGTKGKGRGAGGGASGHGPDKLKLDDDGYPLQPWPVVQHVGRWTWEADIRLRRCALRVVEHCADRATKKQIGRASGRERV